MKVRWHSAALTEAFDSVDGFDAERSGLGDEFLADLEGTLRRVQRYPRIGRSISERHRRVLVRRFRYAVIYELQPDTIYIVGVGHQQRDPGFWRDRT